MLFSLMVAFVVTPWAALKVLRGMQARPTRRGIRDAPLTDEKRPPVRAWPTHFHPSLQSHHASAAASQLAMGLLAVVAGLTVGSMGSSESAP